MHFQEFYISLETLYIFCGNPISEVARNFFKILNAVLVMMSLKKYKIFGPTDFGDWFYEFDPCASIIPSVCHSACLSV